MRRKEYVGEDITVTFDMSKCIHARNCFLKLPEAFDPAQRPWVQPDNAPAEEIAFSLRLLFDSLCRLAKSCGDKLRLNS